MPTYSDKLHDLTAEKAKFYLAKAKLDREARLAMINSAQSLTPPTTSGRNDKEIGEILREVFALEPQFVGLPQEKISKIFQHRFRYLNLYKLRHLKGREKMYQDQIAIKDGTLQIQKITGSYRDYGNDEAF